MELSPKMCAPTPAACSGMTGAASPKLTGKESFYVNKQGNSSSLKHVRYQQQHSVEGKLRKLVPPAMIDVQIIGTGTPGTPASFLINMDHFKYLFNSGEGTQRVPMGQKMKVSRVQDIFITSNCWENVGGLMGMCLFIESMDVPAIRIHGPEHVEKLVTQSKGFAQLHRIKIEKRELSLGYHEDSAMRVDYIPLSLSADSADQPAEKRQRLTETRTSCTVVAYLCQPHPKPRNVCLEKCVDLGISKGPLIGQLKGGSTVTLPDGRVIEPDDILAPAEPNRPFLVLECPSVDYVDAVSKASQLQDIELCLIVHQTQQSVLLSPQYQHWIQSFGDETKHLVVNASCPGLVFQGVYRIQTMLNLLHPQIFPLLPPPPSKPCQETEHSDLPNNVIYAEPNLRVNIRSKTGLNFNRDQCCKLDEDAYRKEILDRENLPEILQNVADQIQAHSRPDVSTYPEILFLGTGSSIPNKVRNVSAIWLNLSETQAVLLDCGENTLGQLMRHYGNQADDMLMKLSAIFVSHLHADHHLGIISIAKERKQLVLSRGQEVNPLTIVSTMRLANWYRSLGDLHLDMSELARVIPSEAFYPHPPEDVSTVEAKELVARLNMKNIEMVRVYHRQQPHGVVLVHNDGWKLVYSGDTIPVQSLVNAGQNCDVLIHEASMEDTLEEDAKYKRHSTTSQAIQVGLDMKAKFILLTHFSQRYAKVPLFNENFSSKVGIAFDNMRVKLSELPAIPHFLPGLKAMFAQEYADMEERTQKLTFRKEYGTGSGPVKGTDRGKRDRSQGRGKIPKNSGGAKDSPSEGESKDSPAADTGADKGHSEQNKQRVKQSNKWLEKQKESIQHDPS